MGGPCRNQLVLRAGASSRTSTTAGASVDRTKRSIRRPTTAPARPPGGPARRVHPSGRGRRRRQARDHQRSERPPWFRLKTGRWRGAVFVDPDGQPWLCAAGLRREDEATDFYAEFRAGLGSRGASAYKPTGDDYDRLKLEKAVKTRTDWERSLYVSVFECVADAVEFGHSERTIPGPGADEQVARMTIDVERMPGDWDDGASDEIPAEVALQVLITDWS